MRLDIENFMSNVIKQKEDVVGKLISILQTTNDFYIGNKIAFILVDNFCDDRIESCLVELIKSSRWKNQNGTLLYLLGEYTNDSKYLYFLVDMLLKNNKNDDGEIEMSAYSMIINLQSPLDRKEISKSLQLVRKEAKKENLDKKQRNLVYSLLDYLEGQRQISKFYNRFAPRSA